jgi:hypothetical protein
MAEQKWSSKQNIETSSADRAVLHFIVVHFISLLNLPRNYDYIFSFIIFCWKVFAA